MSSPDGVDPGAPTPTGGLSSSVVALVLGIVLAVLVSKVFDTVGWGGELASQAAGAASGSAPLLIDGARQRRARPRRVPLTGWLLSARRLSPVLVSSIFAFAVLLADSLVGFVLFRTTRYVITVSGGDLDRFARAYAVVGSVLVIPVVVIVTALCAVSATHRLPPTYKRWLAFALLLWVVVRAAMLLASPPETAVLGPGVGTLALVLGLVLTAGLLLGAALVGGWWAKRTQVTFTAATNFRRLSPDDQRAALSLLAEAPEPTGPSGPVTAGPSTPPSRSA